MGPEVILFVGEALSKYGFPEGHPFSVDRQGAFWSDAQKQGLDKQVSVPCCRVTSPLPRPSHALAQIADPDS